MRCGRKGEKEKHRNNCRKKVTNDRRLEKGGKNKMGKGIEVRIKREGIREFFFFLFERNLPKKGNLETMKNSNRKNSRIGRKKLRTIYQITNAQIFNTHLLST